MTQYYSRSDTVYSGSAIVSIPFSYISKDDIRVKILREVEGEETEITATFTWQNDSQIAVTTELQTGDVISVRRKTSIDEKIVTYSNEGMILNDDNLNMSQDQVLNAVQEMYDDNVTFEIKVDGDIGEIETTASTALTKATTALSTANTADSNASTALSNSQTALSNSQTALSNSQTASSNASTALSNSQTAVSTATTASNKVDTFGETIQAVIEAAEQIEELEEAIDEALEAASTAEEAATQATQAAEEAVQALSTKQDVLVSGTNIKTVNSTSLLGSGNIDVGTVTSVNNIQPVNGNVTLALPDPLPSQTGQAGKYLTTNGTNASWADVDSLPSQTGQAGKYLTTDGTAASWGDLNGKTDTDLSNLTATGINNLVQYANELDWNNEIVITTSSMSSTGEYSVPSDGIVIACAIGNGTTSNSKRIIAGFFRDNTGTESGGSNVLPYTHFLTSAAFSHFVATEYFTYMEGDTCYYYARAEGFTDNFVRVSFIPFKKTI